jgi:hypothetical protein
MPYEEKQLISVSFLTNFELQINAANLDQSIAIMNYIKYSPTYELLETREIRITGGEIRGIIPNLDVILTNLANIYNPFDPNAKLPLTEETL